MAISRKLTIYLQDGLRQDAEAGNHNFFGILDKAFKDKGFEVAYLPDTPDELLHSEQRDGYSLFHLQTPFHDRALDVRLAYMYPFWRIEKAQWREDYQVAKARFDPSKVDEAEAKKFFRFWRHRLGIGELHRFVGVGSVLIALQGRLLDRRHGQSMTPVEMIRETIAQDRIREIVIKLHPKETYSDAELAALQEFENNPRVSFRNDDIGLLLNDCDYVVTQNSSVAFKGMLHTRPAILFGASDFHHLFQNVNQIGVARAFRNVTAARMAYAKYVYWFLQGNSINAGREGAAERILAYCRRFGWEI